MQSKSYRYHSKSAFTLIELLVVIAIIAILAAILFPVFAQAKAAAKKTTSLSNIKQTSLGVLMYMNDSDDVFPQGAGDAPIGTSIYAITGGWVLDTQPYIKSLSLLRDPGDPASKNLWYSWYPSLNGVSISYASNGIIGDFGEGWQLHGVMGWNDTKALGGWLNRGITPQSAVTKSAESIMLTSRYDGNTVFRTGAIVCGQSWWDGSGASLNPDGSRDGTPYTATNDETHVTYVINKNNRYGAVATTYGTGLGIFSYVDGHARAADPISTNPNQQTQPEKNQWNVYRQ